MQNQANAVRPPFVQDAPGAATTPQGFPCL